MVQSINDGIGLTIIDVFENENTPIWDLLPTTGYTKVRGYLQEAYVAICGDKYNEYLEKYPYSKRNTDFSSDASSYIGTIEGYSSLLNGITSNYSFEDSSSSTDNKAFKNSIITMDA